ncbi:MAG: YdiU family protein [Burkholderiales bacterium]|nr:YdiU family protein [Burkholderiales bacterium]
MNSPAPPAATKTLHTLTLGNRFATLPAAFYTVLQPTPLPAPYLVARSPAAAALLDLDVAATSEQEFIDTFTGNRLLPGSQPLAAVYSGHQFGVWAGQLGDGRAILLGDAADRQQQRWEIQLKGSGLTPYSRMGDGRAVLRSSIREFLCSEAMAALGIPTSRALCITGSDQHIMRETPETTAVVTRLAPSFIRFGSFEHWYYNDRAEQLQILADFVLAHYFPDLRQQANPYQALLAEVTRRTAELIAQWQAVGFMHGVMNTDNMSILGLTIDYGPYGFMEAYDEQHICNHTDRQGRYSYRMQPTIGHWNCHALGQALLPLIGSVAETQAALATYEPAFQRKWDALLHRKFGLQSTQEQDQDLFQRYFALLQESHADFTLSFRQLSHLGNQPSAQDEALRDLFIDRTALDLWLENYRQRLASENSDEQQRQQGMLSSNPKYVLRNYLAQIAIEKAQNKDFSEIEKLLRILERPYDEQPEYAAYANLPPDWAGQLEVSCSS